MLTYKLDDKNSRTVANKYLRKDLVIVYLILSLILFKRKMALFNSAIIFSSTREQEISQDCPHW